jgi:hypothetical protein
LAYFEALDYGFLGYSFPKSEKPLTRKTYRWLLTFPKKCLRVIFLQKLVREKPSEAVLQRFIPIPNHLSVVIHLSSSPFLGYEPQSP